VNSVAVTNTTYRRKSLENGAGKEISLSVSLRKVKIRSANFPSERAYKANLEIETSDGLLNIGKFRGNACRVFGNSCKTN